MAKWIRPLEDVASGYARVKKTSRSLEDEEVVRALMEKAGIEEKKKRGGYMFKKLVYMAGKPFWLLPEGSLLDVEQRNGRIVDPVVFRKKNDDRINENTHLSMN